MKRFATILALCSLLLFAAYAWGLGEGGITGGGSGTGGTPDDDSVTSAKIVDATIVAADIATGAVATAEILDNTIANADVNSAANIDATKLGTGLVTNTEFNYIDNVTSSIQDQLDAKAPLVAPSFTTPTLGVATATTLDTGQGANELYDMDQNVLTTSDVVFKSLTVDEVISTCTPAGDNCYVEAVNDGDIAAADQAAGRMYFDNAANMVKVVANDNGSIKQVFTSGAVHTLPFVTTGVLGGRVKVLTDNTAPLAADMGGLLLLWTQNGTSTLPSALAGMAACILDSGTAHDLILDVQAGDDIEMTAGQQANGTGITNASGSSTADYACVIAPTDGHWVLMGSRGTWASQ